MDTIFQFIVNCSSRYFLFNLQCYAPIHTMRNSVCEDYLTINQILLMILI